MGILQIILVIVLIGTAGYGLFVCVTDKAPMYFQMVICAMLSCAFSAIDSSLLYSLLGIYPVGFKISGLSMFASFMFILSANYGSMDNVIDEHRKEERKYRLISLLAPAVIILELSLFAVLGKASIADKIFLAVTNIPAIFASYFNLKHAIFPDFSIGFVKSMRPYNVVAVLFLLFTVFLNITSFFEGYTFYNIATVLCILVDLLMVPTCKYGIDKSKKIF